MKNIVLIIVGLFVSILQAQDFQGVATYKTKRKIDVKLDSTSVNDEMQKQIQEMLKKQFEKEFKLTFNASESMYKEVEKLNSHNPHGMQVVVMGTGGSDILYKNIKDKRFTNQNELMGKLFLVKDKLEQPEWTLTQEQKNIGNYTCYKATQKREITQMSMIEGHGESEQTEEKKEIEIVAWYTPQIPVSNGPSDFWGLPGLILEVNNGDEVMICSKIVMNPKDKISIKEPTKGKEVNQEKYNDIAMKKMKEMQERYAPRRGDSDGIEIRIGG